MLTSVATKNYVNIDHKGLNECQYFNFKFKDITQPVPEVCNNVF